MNFDFNEFLIPFFEQYPGLSPTEIWEEHIKPAMCDAQKLAVFNQSAGLHEVHTRRRNWINATKIAVSPSVHFGSADHFSSQSGSPTKHQPVLTFTSSAPAPHINAGNVYDEHAELRTSQCTHNPARGDTTLQQWVALGDWTQQDFKCWEEFVHSKAQPYLRQAKWAHSVQTIFMDTPEAETLRDIYSVVLDKVGSMP